MVDGVTALPDFDQFIAAVRADSLSSEPLDELAAAAGARDELDEMGQALLLHFVERARDAGCSWSQVGAAMGVSKQAAQQRHTASGSLARRLLTRLSGVRDPMRRFTDRARSAVEHAAEEASVLSHNYIGTEHLLLGLLREPEAVAAKALDSLGVSLVGVRGEVEELIGRGDCAPSEHAPFTPRAKKVLELALRESLELGHNYIGTEHILLGLIREGEGVAAQVLVRLGADLPKVRNEVIRLLTRLPRQ